MNEQRVRETAEAAFKSQFGAVEIVSVNVRPGFDHDEDPKVDVKVIYDGKYEQLNGAGLLRVQSDIVSEAWREVEDDLGFPCVHFLPMSSIGRRGPATVRGDSSASRVWRYPPAIGQAAGAAHKCSRAGTGAMKQQVLERAWNRIEACLHEQVCRCGAVRADVKDVRTMIARFLATPASGRRAFAIHVLMKVRADA